MLLQRFIKSSLINHQPIRWDSYWRNVRPILGWPRPYNWNKGKKYPEPHKYNWLPYLPEDGSYTTKPLPIYKMGGRDLETGRVVVRTLGGGNPKKFRWIDSVRKAHDDGSVKEEVVLMIKYDPLHTPKIALVADGERMRWIYASNGIQKGDVIKTFSEIPKNPVRAKEGDAHPVGALPIGTKIHALETEPGAGPKFCLAAGSSAEIVKRAADGVTVKLPHEDQFKIDKTCMAVVGKMSNTDHEWVEMWCPQRVRWLGKRPGSGQWRRKDGWCGRKIRPSSFIDVTQYALEAKRSKELEASFTFDA